MSEKQIETSSPDQNGCIIKELCPSEAWNLICQHQEKRQTVVGPNDSCSLMILDVRTALEFSINHLEGSINLDFKSPSFSELISGLDKKMAYLVYCRTGVRSSRAVLLMRDLGFRELYSLAGGLSRWHSDGFRAIWEKKKK